MTNSPEVQSCKQVTYSPLLSKPPFANAAIPPEHVLHFAGRGNPRGLLWVREYLFPCSGVSLHCLKLCQWFCWHKSMWSWVSKSSLGTVALEALLTPSQPQHTSHPGLCPSLPSAHPVLPTLLCKISSTEAFPGVQLQPFIACSGGQVSQKVSHIAFCDCCKAPCTTRSHFSGGIVGTWDQAL